MRPMWNCVALGAAGVPGAEEPGEAAGGGAGGVRAAAGGGRDPLHAGTGAPAGSGPSQAAAQQVQGGPAPTKLKISVGYSPQPSQ